MIAYESLYKTFPERITNAEGHVGLLSFDARWGLPTSVTDVNAADTDFSYDGFGRLTKVEAPEMRGPSGSNYRPTAEFTYYSPTTSNGRTTTKLLTRQRLDLGGATPQWRSNWRFFDGLGRVVQSYDEAGASVKVSDRYYGSRGLTEKGSVPHLIPAADSFQDADWSGYSGAATSYTADELRRSTQVTHPDGALSKWTYSGWDNEAIDRLGRKRKFERDALGRLIRVREYTGKNSWSEYAVTNYGRDVANRMVSVTDHSGNASSISYDKLGRKTAMADPDMGSWSYEYHPTGTLMAQTDAEGQRTEFSYDSLGRLTRKYYPPSWTEGTITAGISRPTVYDIMELRSAVDVTRAAAGVSDQVWTDPTLTPGVHRVRAVHFTQLRSAISLLWSQAGLGSIPEFTAGAIAPRTRAIKASDLTDLRGWLAQYEESSYGLSRRARSIYEYDDYDGSSQYGRGRLTGMRDVSGSTRFYYDRAGRMWKTERTIDGNVYPFSWSRDALGRVYQMSYPDGEVLTYSYGADGHLSALASSIGGQIVSSIVYNALGRASSYTLGASPSSEVRSTYYGLDAAGTPYGAMKTLQWQQGTSPMLIDREMLYDASGNLTRLTDRSNSETINFVYDDLDRLTSAGAPVSESYGYDRIGNLTTKNGQALSYTNPAHKHAVSGFGGTSYGYDANGDMVSRGSQTIGYDPERRPVRVVVAGVTQWRTSFGADGKRRKRLDDKGTIHYVGPYERKVGGADGTEAVTKHYYALGKLVAVRKNGTISYLGTDQLGSPIRVADASFSPVDRMRYTPFGNSRDTGTSLPTDRRFTGQTEDASVGLYWYGSRAYDPAIGRFTSPDTIVPTILNPQGLNRYSYVTNNPTKYSDPSGHQAADGQTLDSQSPEVQAMFGDTYGEAAAAQWEAEHNAEIGASAAPSPVDAAAVAAAAPPPPPVETPAPPEPVPAAAPVVESYAAVATAATPAPIAPVPVPVPTPSATPDTAPPVAGPRVATPAVPSAVPTSPVFPPYSPPPGPVYSPPEPDITRPADPNNPSLPYPPEAAGLADYNKVNVSVGLVSVDITVDRFGSAYVAPGIGIGLSPFGASISQTAGQLDATPPLAKRDLNAFLTGLSITKSVGLGPGGGEVDSGWSGLQMTSHAREAGMYSPQAGVSINFGIPIGNLNFGR